MDGLAEKREISAMENKIFASGYVYSNAILPYINDVDSDASSVIQTNMAFNFEESVFKYRAEERHEQVFESIAKVVGGLGIRCSDIGYMAAARRGVCMAQGSGNSWKSSSWKSSILLPITFFLLW